MKEFSDEWKKGFQEGFEHGEQTNYEIGYETGYEEAIEDGIRDLRESEVGRLTREEFFQNLDKYMGEYEIERDDFGETVVKFTYEEVEEE